MEPASLCYAVINAREYLWYIGVNQIVPEFFQNEDFKLIDDLDTAFIGMNVFCGNNDGGFELHFNLFNQPKDKVGAKWVILSCWLDEKFDNFFEYLIAKNRKECSSLQDFCDDYLCSRRPKRARMLSPSPSPPLICGASQETPFDNQASQE
jgi:hypothetical protein